MSDKTLEEIMIMKRDLRLAIDDITKEKIYANMELLTIRDRLKLLENKMEDVDKQTKSTPTAENDLFELSKHIVEIYQRIENAHAVAAQDRDECHKCNTRVVKESDILLQRIYIAAKKHDLDFKILNKILARLWLLESTVKIKLPHGFEKVCPECKAILGNCLECFKSKGYLHGVGCMCILCSGVTSKE